MASVSGLDGSVTFASGYTTDVDSWIMRVFSTPLDKTAFQPTDNHQVLCSDMVNGAEGRYTAKVCVTTDSDITDTGDLYDPYPHRWFYRSEMTPRMATAFGDSWHSWNTGLISTMFRMQTWLDTAQAPPTVLSGTATLALDGTNSYEIPYRSTSIDIGVAVDDDGRREALIEGQATGAITANLLPEAGTSGSAEFLLDSAGGAKYTTNIIVTAVEMVVDRLVPEGQIAVEFVVNNTLTGATGA